MPSVRTPFCESTAQKREGAPKPIAPDRLPSRVPHPSSFEGWDSTVVSRYFLLTSRAALPKVNGRGRGRPRHTILRFKRRRVGARIYHRTQNAPTPYSLDLTQRPCYPTPRGRRAGAGGSREIWRPYDNPLKAERIFVFCPEFVTTASDRRHSRSDNFLTALAISGSLA